MNSKLLRVRATESDGVEVTCQMVDAAYDEYTSNYVEFVHDSDMVGKKRIIRARIERALLIRNEFPYLA